MFDGDNSQFGRRERLQRKMDAKNAFTGKIGDLGSNDVQPSNVRGGLFSQESRRPELDSRAADSSARGARSGASEIEGGSKIFTARVSAKRHAYEVEIVCQAPILDMVSNPKRRAITFYADVGGQEEAFSVQIPQGFQIEDTTFLNEDFANGKCSVAVPAVQRNVFN